MNTKLYRALFIILPLLIAFGAFEILNIDTYYKEMIEIPKILIQESKQPAKVKATKLNELTVEGCRVVNEKYLVEVAIIILSAGWLSMIYFTERKGHKPTIF